MTMPVVYQYNATIQRQLTDKIAITGGYVGNSTRHGWMGTSNTINPNEAIMEFNHPDGHTAVLRAVRMDPGLGVLLQLHQPTIQLLPVHAHH
jgi:hypothetical protein